MTPTICAPWCAYDHDSAEGCLGEPYEIPADSSANSLMIGVHRAPETGMDALLIHELGGPAGQDEELRLSLATLLHLLSPTQAVLLRDGLMELVCVLGACDCGHGPICRRAGCEGGCGAAHGTSEAIAHTA